MVGTLAGNVAVVTGGGRGIGVGIAQALLEEGASVVISQRTPDELERAAAELSQFGPVSFKVCDVTKRAQVEALLDYAIETYGRLDVLAANHGMDHRSKFLELTEEAWDQVIDVNLKGMFLCGQAAAQRMVSSRTKGRIVLTSSICGPAAEPDCAHYNTSKGGVSALCKAMAVDLAPYGITTNVVSPGWILTQNTEFMVTPAQLAGEEPFPVNPLGRIGRPLDIGRAVAYFADPRNSFVSGVILPVDGAQTAELVYLDAVTEAPQRLWSSPVPD
jgi:NAD(P)-dependent dehydrogenase (short-subunit alcohol dehydrogenase family)